MIKKYKPKVIWLHSHFMYWMGGTKYLFEVVSRLKNKFDITVIVENASPLAKKYYKDSGIKLVSMNKTTSISPIYWLTFPYQLYKSEKFVSNYINKNLDRKTVVVSNMFPMNVIASRLPYMHVQYCFEPFAFFHDPEFIKNFPLTKRLFIILISILYKGYDIEASSKASRIITLNNTTAKYIKEIYGQTPEISYTGINTKHFRPYVNKKLEDKYNNKKVIIHSTDYTPVKGTERMIRIFAKVKEKEPRAHLLITSTIDNNPEKQRLEEIAKSLGVRKSIEFLGFVDYDLLPQYYSLAKALVQCSYSERSGTTSMALPVKESMAAGTMAIRFPVKNEDVEDGVTGYLVDPRNEKEMVDKILKILDMGSIAYKKAVKRARSYIVKKYTWKNTADIIYKEIKKEF